MLIRSLVSALCKLTVQGETHPVSARCPRVQWQGYMP